MICRKSSHVDLFQPRSDDVSHREQLRGTCVNSRHLGLHCHVFVLVPAAFSGMGVEEVVGGGWRWLEVVEVGWRWILNVVVEKSTKFGDGKTLLEPPPHTNLGGATLRLVVLIPARLTAPPPVSS